MTVLPASAQTWSLPGKGTPANCAACPGAAKGKPTVPFSDPLVRHVARFVDSAGVGNSQNEGMRTLRAREIRVFPAQNRILVQMGETVSIYRLDTFFGSRLTTGFVEANKAFQISVYNPWRRIGSGLEKVSTPDQYFYAEAKDSGWPIGAQDTQKMLEDWDYDDRGYIYAESRFFGWGVSRDEGKTDRTHVTKVAYWQSSWANQDTCVISIKTAGKYYVAHANSRALEIFDVTTPTALGNDNKPPLVRKVDDGMMFWAKHDGSQRVAIADTSKVRIYSYAGFISGDAPLATYNSTKIGDVTFDENGRLYIIERGSKIVRFDPSGSGFSKQEFPNSYGGASLQTGHSVNASGGYLAIIGTNTALKTDLYLYKVDGGGLQLLNLNNFVSEYYFNAPTGYAAMNLMVPSYAEPRDAEIVEQGNKTYLIVSAGGLGDVYELQAGDSISIQQGAGPYGTANPNAKSTESGPFYGDILKFRATTNSSNNYGINWNFGNPDSGTSNTTNSGLNQDVLHQFTGLDTQAEVAAAKTVTATVLTDASVSDSFNVSLKVPIARIGVPGFTNAMTQSSRFSFDAVLGDKLTDASDGVVEGHFTEWTIDNVSTKKQPNETMDVGALGQHSLAMVANYGSYNPTTFAISQPFKATVNNVSYNVKPFIAAIKPPVTTGTDYVFNADARVTAVPGTITATQWTVTWSLVNSPTSSAIGSESIIETQADPVAIGTIPPFNVAKSPSPDGKFVRLQITVDAASAPVGYASYTTYMPLSIPNIAVSKTTGCVNAGEPCTLTASAVTGTTSGWQLAWTVKRNGTTVKTGNGLSVTFTPDAAGTYTATAHETAYNISAEHIFTVAASVCSPVPESVTISTDCGTSCKANQPIQFEASIFPGRNEPCDQFTWEFGDNTTSNLRAPVHTFATNKTYAVKLTIKNNNSTRGTGTWTQNVNVGVEPPPQPLCTLPTAISVIYTGSKGCNASKACEVGETVTFSGRRSGGQLQNCDTVAWTVDGTAVTATPVARTAVHTFTTTGSHTVGLTVSNENGAGTPVTVNLNVVPSTVACSGSVPADTLSAEIIGSASECTGGAGSPCQLNELITFTASAFGYTFQQCDRFEWNFGDNTAVATQRTVTHVYSGARNSATVSLKVYNTANPAGVTVTKQIFFGTINQDPAPVLGYAGFPATGAKNSPVTFTVNSNVDATGWSWDFNDGTPVNNSQASIVGKTTSITHTFTKTGTFNVKVTARRSATGATLIGQMIGTIVVSETPQFRYLLPVVTHIGGQGGSVWRTDVQIYNPDPNVSASNPLVMTATLRDNTKTLQISDSTYIFEDFMNRFSSGDDSGPVIITTNAAIAPQIWTRTYNQTEAGTFGQFIPAVRLDAAGGGAAAGTGKYFLAGLRANVRYRTNLGLVNPQAQALPVTISVYDDVRIKKAQFTRMVQPYQLLQFNIAAADAAPSIDPNKPFSVELTVPDGQWLIAYASYIDGGSNDPVYIPAVRESELSSTDLSAGILPGVGHVGAWRSDVTIFNPNNETLVVDLAYYDQSGNKTGQASAVPIRAGEFLQYDDILKQGVFGNVNDSLGMLRVNVSSFGAGTLFPMTFARTYNDNGSGKTYGQGIRGFGAAQANVKPNKPALIPGVRKNSKYRTNIGLTNVSNSDVTASIKVLDPSTGAVVRTTQVPLKALESIVAPDISLEGRENASVRIEVTGGNVWAFASLIDAGTSDPEYISAIPMQ